MSKANYALRLQNSLKDAAEKAAAAEGASLNQFINVAIAEKISALETETYFRKRAASASERAFWDFLDGAGVETPRPGDELDR
jgi:uncharacterized protein (DUF1778 family)